VAQAPVKVFYCPKRGGGENIGKSEGQRIPYGLPESWEAQKKEERGEKKVNKVGLMV